MFVVPPKIHMLKPIFAMAFSTTRVSLCNSHNVLLSTSITIIHAPLYIKVWHVKSTFLLFWHDRYTLLLKKYIRLGNTGGMWNTVQLLHCTEQQCEDDKRSLSQVLNSATIMQQQPLAICKGMSMAMFLQNYLWTLKSKFHIRLTCHTLFFFRLLSTI